MAKKDRVLLMTIGVGNPNDLEGTLYGPLQKSIDKGVWRKIILLPSRLTCDNARELVKRRPKLDIDIHPLPLEQDENNVDACFEHFDSEIQKVLESGIHSKNVFADFTRGTKAMSAALVMAALRRGIKELRYIEGERKAGVVIPGSEKIRDFLPLKAIAARRLDACRTLLDRGAFSASAELLDPEILDAEGWDRDLKAEATYVRQVAGFLSAWDRLNYSLALERLGHLNRENSQADWARFIPNPEVKVWIMTLAEDGNETDTKFMETRTRDIAIDLVANAERCVNHGRYEDALVRAYRAWELLGQMAMFSLGYDSAKVPAADSCVKQYIANLERKKSNIPNRLADRRNGTSYYQFARLQVARFLKFMKEPSGQKLIAFGEKGNPGEIFIDRNTSVLIHGFSTKGPDNKQDAARLVNGLKQLVSDILGDDGRKDLVTASWPNSFSK